MGIYPAGQTQITPLTGAEQVEIDGGGAMKAFTTTAGIAALASQTSTTTTITALNTVGAGTITAAGIVGKITSRGGAQSATAFSDTTDTAAAIIAALPSSAPTGTSFLWRYANNTNGNATIVAGSGITLSGNVIVPKLTWTEFLVKKTSATAVSITSVDSGQIVSLPVSVTDTQAITVGVTLQVGGLTGGQVSTLILTSATAQAVSLALPPATELIAAIPNAAIGTSYTAIIRNAFTTSSVATITGSATGVTLSGTATIAQAASGMFNILITGAATYTATRIGP